MAVSAPKWREESHRGAGDSSQRFVRIGMAVMEAIGAGSNLSCYQGALLPLVGTTWHRRPPAPGLVFQPVHQTGIRGSFN